MFERGNTIKHTLPERSNLIPIHTSQSQVHHKDHTTRGYSWHTIIQLSSSMIRVTYKALLTYVHA